MLPGADLLDAARWRALELLADRWTLWLVLAIDDSEGSRFSDLAPQPGLSKRVLSERLDRLIEAQFVQKRQYQATPKRYRYELTQRGVRVRRMALSLLHVAAGGGRDVPLEQLPQAPAPMPVRQTHPTDRLLETDPVAARTIYEDTIAPLARYDEQYRTPLVDTLVAYLDCDASVSVTAARLYAHRHTVRYRLGRVRELTGLDVDSLADRERLVLGLRAMQLFRFTGDPDNV
jgi:DNA-binding HxlR family transcriptional regulator